jgi:predicted ATPase
MTDRPRITRVVLENYKSIAYCDVRLGPLTFLVGPNGSGKSNFMDALQFLADAMQFPLQDVFQRRFGFDAVLREGQPQPTSFGIRVEFQLPVDRTGFYAVRIEAVDSGTYRVVREQCDVLGETILDSEDSDRYYLRLADPSLANSAAPQALLRDIRIYIPDPGAMRRPQPEGPGRLLSRDASNIADVVKRMHIGQNDAFTRVEQYLKVITPDVDQVRSRGMEGYRRLDFRTANQIALPGHCMSDGTLKSLAILVALFQSVRGGPDISIVEFEEPEAGLHPAATAVLLDAMREASLSVQVVASSHSADLLDDKEIDSDSILAVEQRDGLTYVSPVDAASRQVLKDRLYTVGELLRMEQLRPAVLDDEPPSARESLLFEGT